MPNASMQKGRASRAIDDMTFVRFEVALDVFNEVVESYVEGPPPMAEAAE